jgi:hypothetical protein
MLKKDCFEVCDEIGELSLLSQYFGRLYILTNLDNIFIGIINIVFIDWTE